MEITTKEEKNKLKKSTHTCSSICPSFDYLINEKITTDVTCIVPNCDEIFSNTSALKLHLKKVHRIEQTCHTDEILLTRAKSKSQKVLDNCECKYYCPIEKCKFFLGSSHSLPTFHSLKNHFIRMHGNKSYTCEKCQKNFAIKSEFQRHSENCGLLFKCPTCECPYASKSSLIKHLRLKNHGSIEEPQLKSKKKVKINETSNEISQPNKLARIAPLNELAKPSPIIFIQIDKDTLNMHSNRSFGCQTHFNESQSTGCQTYYDPISLNYDQHHNQQEQQHNTTSQSTDMASFQSQETQTLNVALPDDEYISMILADISTQTTEYDCNNNVTTSNDYRSCSIQTSEVGLNTTCTQTTENQAQMGFNLELTNLDTDIYFNNDLCNDSQANYDTIACQTNDYYFQNSSTSTTNTVSIQTQTNMYYSNNNNNYLDTSGNFSRYIDTITQTDWNLIDQNF